MCSPRVHFLRPAHIPVIARAQRVRKVLRAGARKYRNRGRPRSNPEVPKNRSSIRNKDRLAALVRERTNREHARTHLGVYIVASTNDRFIRDEI